MFAVIRMFGYLLTINEVKTQVFIEYLTNGGAFVGNKIKEVESREHPTPEDFPSWTYAYSFFERDYVEIEEQRVHLGKRKNVSKLYYPQGRLVTIEELKKEFPDKAEQLIRNMKSAKADKVIYCRERNFLLYDPENDVILP
ncbi:MAG: hypothetical protein XD87_0132 [candidate division WS6 bacterium 36_33]|uniref:Uncharacterized protein n=1 Tax=candidate division WS6 bacterium 36_33 TaxID=1641388 RepID=A0A101GZ96_9BACT|nr:MAG: hypothetical protein XD87_0132 [candidate division WS6 bacterium 36_33]